MRSIGIWTRVRAGMARKQLENMIFLAVARRVDIPIDCISPELTKKLPNHWESKQFCDSYRLQPPLSPPAAAKGIAAVLQETIEAIRKR